MLACVCVRAHALCHWLRTWCSHSTWIARRIDQIFNNTCIACVVLPPYNKENEDSQNDHAHDNASNGTARTTTTAATATATNIRVAINVAVSVTVSPPPPPPSTASPAPLPAPLPSVPLFTFGLAGVVVVGGAVPIG